MVLTFITAWILILLGTVLGAGGMWLAALGGSWAYGLAGTALVACGALLVRRRRIALGVYAALLAAMAVWSLWEVGLDRWALVPRGALLAVVGLWLLAPWIDRTLCETGMVGAPARSSWRGPRGWLAGAMLLVVALAAISITRDPFDVAGLLPDAAVSQIAAPGLTDPPGAAGEDWPAYGGTGLGQRYSSLADITPATASRLGLAWAFHTGETPRPSDPVERTFEVTPLKVDDLLYLCSVRQQAIALDAATGQVRWRFDPHIEVDHSSQHLTCRGLAFFDGTGAASAALASAPAAVQSQTCARRIFLPTIDARLYALDAQTGEPCLDFGDKGVVDLSAGMPNLRAGAYMQTSPPVVAAGVVIVGGSINDNASVHNPSGVIRAFDARSGRLVWNFDPGRPDATAPLLPGQTYTAGAPNNWAPSSVDAQLGLVYIGLGNRSPDQLGAGRNAEVERFSSALIALDVTSGKLRWVFQTVHHDLWDRDVPAQPSLIDLTIDGKVVPALVMPTKQGDLYVLDRRSGQPILPVRELSAPASTVPGEFAAPTQPHSSLSFMPPALTGKDMWGATPLDQLICRIQLRRLGYDGPYTPPSTQRTLVYPGNLGVFNWGGVAVDPVRQIMVGTPAFLAFTFELIPRPDATANVVSAGASEHWNENHGAAYAVKIGPFLSPIGLPCQAPPWGAIAGVNLRTGERAWMHRHGTVRDQMPGVLPIPFPMGVASLGGPLITAGGVVFYSGTLDNYLRAYDVTTGRKLWQSRLPAGGQATPMTYRIHGRQMVVVAAGGHGSFGTTPGDTVLAYELK
ncbi:membrane-bound PQQ-dependent dehydrogenase, glucose/quinate/shikimate family [Marinobacterium sedimentorum]|uniref:membrane-bound PQQ-dependent dehydrogenase, glucose/quinate/shikimate family n=1 Tax=Marinobacterium sedimentorum TaxID=2927804 RepID=UPI0020C63AFC|nr:membrane-bound PQQ-dependent dehydrogenase, glucose/quinate/shikimate family [Marinobacterium sedimentorum]MCP8688447.1 membrane-bound PQQ-dependent dehydrogenase, glucose/quinate/shikimate family [Marinobacterium sedimentorum]